MKEEQNRAVLLALIDALRKKGSWCGETHIQRTAFFLKELAGVPLGFEFILYKHGMFSFELADELDVLYSCGLVVPEITYPYSPKFVVSVSGKTFQAYFPKTIERYEKQINFVAEKFGSRDTTDLERLSIAYYITMKNPNNSPEDHVKAIVRCRPHISLGLAKQAVHDLERMK